MGVLPGKVAHLATHKAMALLPFEVIHHLGHPGVKPFEEVFLRCLKVMLIRIGRKQPSSSNVVTLLPGSGYCLYFLYPSEAGISPLELWSGWHTPIFLTSVYSVSKVVHICSILGKSATANPKASQSWGARLL